MKKLLFLTSLASMFCLVSFFASCSEDENGGGSGNVPQSVLEAFRNQYGETRASWSVENGYAIAEFQNNGKETTAWYTLADARWGMTETEIPYASLPKAVLSAIEASAYAQWRPDETADMLERNGAETLYVVEMEDKETEVDLYFTEDGVLVNEYVDSDGKENDYSGYLPQTPVSEIESWLAQNFPTARIVDMDVERNGTEVEIVDNGVKYEIWFDASSSWMQTKTEYDLRNIPDVVRNFVQTNYPDYRIDDAEKYETSSNGIYYHIEIEQGYQEKDIYLNAQGEEVERPTGIR